MDSVTPELLEMKARLDAWRTQRKHLRQALPAEIKDAILELIPRYSPSILNRILNIAPWKLRQEGTLAVCPRASAWKEIARTFFQLPAPTPRQRVQPMFVAFS